MVVEFLMVLHPFCARVVFSGGAMEYVAIALTVFDAIEKAVAAAHLSTYLHFVIPPNEYCNTEAIENQYIYLGKVLTFNSFPWYTKPYQLQEEIKMKKSEMTLVIARRASKAWLDLKQYEYYLHVHNFECGEISSNNFHLFCMANPGHCALLHTWCVLEALCDALDICYGAMEDRDEVIKNNNEMAKRADDKLWARSLEFAKGEAEEED